MDGFVWLKCGCCGAELPFLRDSEQAKKHLIDCAIQAQLEAHPEVNEFDPQDGCENLASRPLKRDMFPPEGSVLDGEGPESEDDMGKPSNK